MFGIGGTELLIILLFVFIVVGPEKLPEAATMIGKAIRKFQDAQSEVNKVIKTETADIKAAINNEVKAAEKAPARKPVAKKEEVSKPAETKAEEANSEAAEERPLSFSERKAQYQRERKEREEAAKQAAENGKEE